MMSERGVNSMLHALRGEHFRRQQNLRGSRSHISSTSAFVRNGRTLPPDLISSDYPEPEIVGAKLNTRKPTMTNCPGPKPPKSWTASPDKRAHDRPSWRANALSLVLTPESVASLRLPSLTLLCLRRLCSIPSVDFVSDVIPFIPPHLRRELIRYMAIHSPLPDSRLYPLYEDDGHADAEFIIVGENGSLREDFFLRNTQREDASWEWDSERQTSDVLRTFVLMSSPMSSTHLRTLPATITRMALINLPSPVSLHRLPDTCPLLEVLDLSYNSWLTAPDETDKLLERVDWIRWSYLRILGLRNCFISAETRLKVNKSRWDDVEVVQ